MVQIVFVIDYRKVNRITKFFAEPTGNKSQKGLPNPEEILPVFQKTNIFKLDLAKGYWQIPV